MRFGEAVKVDYVDLADPDRQAEFSDLVTTAEKGDVPYPWVAINGQMDADTMAALAKLDTAYDGQTASVPVDTYLNLYLSVPVTSKSIERAKQFDRQLAQILAAKKKKALKDKKRKAQPPKPKKKVDKKQAQPIEPDKLKEATPKETDSQRELPRPEVIIITPLDAQTHHTLDRIVRRIEVKRKGQIHGSKKPYQAIIYKHETLPPTP